MTKRLAHSANDMFDVLQGNTNGTQFEAAHGDAVSHIADLLTGKLTPETVDDIQDELIDPDAPDYDATYATGYMHAWNATYKMLFDARS